MSELNNRASDNNKQHLSMQSKMAVKLSNTACNHGKYEEAIKQYSDAIKLDPTNHLLYSNRSAAFIKIGKFEDALKDADVAVKLSPSWPKVS